VTAQASLFSWGEEPPPPPPRPVAPPLWPHQRKQYMAVRAELAKEDVRSTLVVSATGTGKTTLLSSVAKTQPGGVLVIAHRDEILTQLQERLELVTGEPVEREQAEYRASRARIVVASIQTIGKERRCSTFPRDRFRLVVIDEAHHAASPTYRAVLDYFGDAKVLGVTATPDRTDRLRLGDVFDSVAHVYDIGDAIADSVLVPYVRREVVVDALDLSGADDGGRDFDKDKLDEAMGDEHVIEGVAKPTFEEAGDRQTVLFTTSVANAHLIAGTLNKLRSGCARAVDAKTEKEDRRAIMRGYANGDFQFLCNMGIATEGWDDPPTSCVAIGRPTKSRALFAQMLGRGLRIHPGKKDCLVLEFTERTTRHDLVTALDVLAGKYSDAEIAFAKEQDRKNPGRRVDAVLADARKELKRREQERADAEAARRATRHVTYTTRVVDPFAVLHMDREGDSELDWQFGKKPPSDKQISFLRQAGVHVDQALSKREATRLIGNVIKRRNLGLCSFKQLATLRKYGITDINIRFETASRLIDAIKANGWRAISPDQYRAALERRPGEDG